MSTSSIRDTLAASLPSGVAQQPGATGLSFGIVEAFPTVATAVSDSAGTGDGLNSAAQVLQSTLQDASDSVIRANKQIAELQAVQQQLLSSTAQNTQALNANTSSKGGGSGALSTAGSIVSGMLGQGSILAPIIGGLMSLFGGHETAPQPVFTVSTMPSPVRLETTIDRSPASPAPSSAEPEQQARAQDVPASQIQIHVNAIDSRSFLDHSNEIAEAVRHALLNSHSLNDVIAEL